MMNTIVLLDNRPKAALLYSVALEVYVGATVIEMNSIDDAVEYVFNNAPTIVITRSPIEERDIGFKLAMLIEQKKFETHLIILGKTKISSHQATIFDENVSVKEVVRKCAELLEITAQDMADKDVGEFYPIKIDLLCANLQLVCPIYRIDVEGIFSPFLDTNSKIHPEVLTILNTSGDECIYVEATDRLKFVNSITVFLSELLADDNLTLEDSLLFASRSYQLVREAARRMMITPEIIQMTEANINTMSSIVSKIPKLKVLLEETTKDIINMMFRHSLLTCYIASHIIEKMEWGTQEQKVKIAFVSFFHDIAIADENHVLIHSDEELDLMNLSEEQRLNVRNHAINAAKILTKYYTSLPMGIEVIVKQHHGSRDGLGFVNYPASVSPLALVFLVAEEWVHSILKAEQLGMPLTKEEALSKIKHKYKSSSFYSIINALNELVI